MAHRQSIRGRYSVPSLAAGVLFFAVACSATSGDTESDDETEGTGGDSTTLGMDGDGGSLGTGGDGAGGDLATGGGDAAGGDRGLGGEVGAGGALPSGGTSSGGTSSGGTSSGGTSSGGTSSGGTSSGGTSSGGASSGGASSGGAPATGGGGGQTDEFVLSELSGVYTYTSDDMSMTIDPDDGGRIVSFVVAGAETLVLESDPAGQHGSVFWPSPQSWGWPPTGSIPQINNLPYAVSGTGDELILTSQNNPGLGLRVTKTHNPTWTSAGVPAIEIVYTMTNTGGSSLGVAPWEISRVKSGMAFYPTGPTGQLPAQSLTVQNSNGHTWYTYNATGLGGVPKNLGDGADGWLAWSTGGSLVIKSFPDIPKASFAPGEAEIELYANPDGTYFEVEQQGAYVNIPAGQSSTWTVLWTGAVIPNGSSTSVGSSDLTTLVTNTL